MIFTIKLYIDGDVYIMMNKENEIKIFSLIAGIEEPWVLEKVEVPWAKPNSGFTILFEEFVMQLAKKCQFFLFQNC